MSRGINKVVLMGRLGGDPIMRTTQTNRPVTNFSMATNASWIDKKTGEQKESTEWHKIVAWNGHAENCNQYLHKGSHVHVEGRLQTTEYQDRDGNMRSKTEIILSEMRMLDPRTPPSEEGVLQDKPTPETDEITESEIPF